MKKILTILVIAFAVVGLYRLADNTHEPQKEMATTTASSTAANYPDGYTAYQEEDFMVGYPDNFSLVSEDTATANAYGSYIPACGTSDYLTCIFYTGDDFAGTNFGAAGVAVRQRSDIDTESRCESTEGNYSSIQNEEEQQITNRKFFTFETKESVMSHRNDNAVYRTYYEDTCWELQARVGSSVYEAYEAGSIDRFSQSERSRIRGQLEKIISTFSLL